MRLILQALPTPPAPAPLHGHKVDLEGPAGALIYCVCAWVCGCCACVSECTIKQSHTLWHLNLNSRTCAVSKYESCAYYKNYLVKNRLHQHATERGRVTQCGQFGRLLVWLRIIGPVQLSWPIDRPWSTRMEIDATALVEFHLVEVAPSAFSRFPLFC